MKRDEEPEERLEKWRSLSGDGGENGNKKRQRARKNFDRGSVLVMGEA